MALPPEAAEKNVYLDLELRLRIGPSSPPPPPPPPSSADRSNTRREREINGAVEGAMSSTDAPATDLGALSWPRNPAYDEESVEPAIKRIRVEQEQQPMTAAAAAAVVVGEEERHGRDDVGAMALVPATEEDERHVFLRRHNLPIYTNLYYVGEKLLRKSDLNHHQARFLLPSSAPHKLRSSFLSGQETRACGFDVTRNRTPIVPMAGSGGGGGRRRNARADRTTYPGVPVSVYQSGGGWGMSELKLNKFHRSDGAVINGAGYVSFMERCGFVAGDLVELWAFRRPPFDSPCIVIAKKT